MKTVLVLEDDPSSLSVLRWVLEEAHRVLVADSPGNAIGICEAEPLDLFVADNLLKASASGIETLCRAHELLPALPLLIVSGTSPDAWTGRDFGCFETLVNSARFDFLHKPFTASAFRESVAALMISEWASNRMQLLLKTSANQRRLWESWRGF